MEITDEPLGYFITWTVYGTLTGLGRSSLHARSLGSDRTDAEWQS